VVIGHPTGLPTKVSAGANVRSVNDVYFVANLDTFGGNSGSAVFNAETGEIEGILVRGERDYRYNSARGCYVPNTCVNLGCRGEDSTLITNLGLTDILNN
jgi:V8-like Glu-specific endopeptidase